MLCHEIMTSRHRKNIKKYIEVSLEPVHLIDRPKMMPMRTVLKASGVEDSTSEQSRRAWNMGLLRQGERMPCLDLFPWDYNVGVLLIRSVRREKRSRLLGSSMIFLNRYFSYSGFLC